MKAIHHVQISIPVGVETQAREFYRDFLGLKEIPKPERLLARGGFWLELGDLQIHFAGEDGVDRIATKAHVAYEVENLPEWKSKLRAQGLEVKESVPIPGLNRFEVRDPFGNRMEFLEKS